MGEPSRRPGQSADARSRSAWASAAEWGRAERMNELDATLWRAERHPERSSTLTSLMVLDRTPDWDRLAAGHEWATTLVPRARQRVLEPLLPTGPPVWVADPHFVLDYHLRRMDLGRHNSWDDLLELIQSLALTPLDRTRPLWEATLIEGLADPDGGPDRAAYFLKLHHSLADGMSIIQLVTAIPSRTRRHTKDKPAAPQPVTEPGQPSRLGLTVHGALRSARVVPTALSDLLSVGRRAVTDPTGTAADGLRFAASLRRVVSPPAAAPSPLLAHRDGRQWLLRTLECPLRRLRDGGRAAGGSVNDAYLAALLGGIRRYHERHDVAIEELPVTIPVSLRRADDPAGGNHFVAVMFGAPIGIVDTEDRIAAVRGAVRAHLGEPALDSFSILTPVANRLPSGVGVAAMNLGGRVDLGASNMPGVKEPIFIAGAKVERYFPFGPLPGVAMMATMLSHTGTCCIGLTLDAAAFPDHKVLMECMQEGLDEVLDLARG